MKARSQLRVPTPTLPPSEPKVRSSQPVSSNSTGLPRSVVYGAVAGLFLLVAGGVGAHKKRHP